MKTEITTAKLRKNACNLHSCGYCAMAHLLRNHEPKYYNSGLCGWNFDVYEVYGVTIVTGYRNLVGKRFTYDEVEKYEKQARAFVEDYSLSYEDRTAKIESLLKEFCLAHGGWV